VNLRDRLVVEVKARQPPPSVVVLDLAKSADLDVETSAPARETIGQEQGRYPLRTAAGEQDAAVSDPIV